MGKKGDKFYHEVKQISPETLSETGIELADRRSRSASSREHTSRRREWSQAE